MHYWIRPDGEIYYTNAAKLSQQEVFTHDVVKDIVDVRKVLSQGWIGIYPNYFTEHQNAIIAKPGFLNPTEAQVHTISKLCIASCVVVYAIFDDNGTVSLHLPTLKFVADEWYLSEVPPIVEGDKHE